MQLHQVNYFFVGKLNRIFLMRARDGGITVSIQWLKLAEAESRLMWQFLNGRHQPLYSVETADHCILSILVCVCVWGGVGVCVCVFVCVWHCVCFRYVTTQTHVYTHTHIHTHSTLNDVCSEVSCFNIQFMKECLFSAVERVYFVCVFFNKWMFVWWLHACLHAIKFMQKHVCGHGNYLCTFVNIKYKVFMEKRECQGERWEQESVCTCIVRIFQC